MNPERRRKGLLKAKRVARIWDQYDSDNRNNKFLKTASFIEPYDINLEIQRLEHNRKKCSCWMCGNQRKHFGKTMPEKKEDGRFKDQINEL